MGRSWTGMLREVRRGLRAAAPFLLSHHVPAERDRCHAIRVAGREVHLCARCTGVYPGVAAALVAGANGVAAPLVAVAALPAPALVEWVLTGRGDRPGRNDVRTLTGFALGLGYGFGLARLLGGPGRQAVLAVGLAYATFVGALVYADTNQENQETGEVGRTPDADAN